MADLFGGAAPYYVKYRTRPPEPAMRRVRDAFGVNTFTASNSAAARRAGGS